MDDDLARDTQSAQQWDALFNPRGVALVGASENRQFSRRLVQNTVMLRGGALDDLALINPRRESAFGERCYPSLKDAPGRIDVAVISVPERDVLAVVEEGLSIGVRAFVVHSSQFAEAGAEGRERQRMLAEACRQAGAILIGPNCLGVVSMHQRWAPYGGYLPQGLRPGNVALVSQSGSAAIALMSSGPRLGFSYIASTGNEAVCTTSDVIDALSGRPDTDVIALFVEQIRDVARFQEATEAARAAGKVLVALKVGSSPSGARVSQSHTGAMVGDQRLYAALFEDSGVVQVDDLNELIETALIFSSGQAPPRRGRAAIIGISGGQLALVADVAAAVGLELAVPAVGAQPDGEGAVQNPLDVAAHSSGAFTLGDEIARAVSRFSADSEVDLICVAQDMHATFEPSQTETYGPFVAAAAAALAKSEKASAFVSHVAAGVHPELLHLAQERGVPVLQGTTPAMKALAAYARFRGRPDLKPAVAARPRSANEKTSLVPSLGPRRGGMLSEPDTKRLLRSYGIPVTSEAVVRSADEAADAAASFGFPVVLKIVSPDITHKSDVGGVLTGLTNPKAVASGYERIIRSVQKADPSADIEGVLVAQHVDGSLELLVGAKFDSDFGPTVVVGLGGTFVELLDNVAVGLRPRDVSAARTIMSRMAGYAALHGARGGLPADLDMVAEVLVQLGTIVADYDGRIADIEINPLLTGLRRGGCIALDARASLA